MQLNRVLVVIEPDSEQQPALDKVLALAKFDSFDIKMISCDYTQYLVEGYYFDAVDLPNLRAEYLAERKQALETLAEPLRSQGLVIETGAVWGHPGYQAIIQEAEGCDLIVTHTRRHSAVSRLFLTNDDWQLVRCCPSPLLLVKEKPWKEKPVVLAAVDPMHARHKPAGLDHKILRVAKEAARLVSGNVYAVHSYRQVPLSGTYLKEAREEHKSAFDTLVEEFGIPATRRHLIEEAPEYGMQMIEQELQADVVVMGAISRSFVADIFVGNTTEKVLDYLGCDVLVLKPDGFVSPLDRNPD